MKNDENINYRLRDIMSTVFDLENEQINDKCSSNNITSWDSLNHIKLLLCLEEEFNITINSSDAGSLTSFEIISNYLKQKIL